MMFDAFTLAIALLALTVSALTLWLTYGHVGRVVMTTPTQVYLGADGGAGGTPKVFLRALLYSTSKRGIALESLYVKLIRGETQQNFSIWVYGDQTLTRGSGLFIGPEGIATNHHFLLPPDVEHFDIRDGSYRLDVFGKPINKTKPKRLCSISVEINTAEASRLFETRAGIYFDWGPDAGRYYSKIDRHPQSRGSNADAVDLLTALKIGTSHDGNSAE